MHPAGGTHPGGGQAWRPATALEHGLLAAVEAGDVDRFERLLAGAEVLLPITAAAAAGQAPVAWSLTDVGDARCVLAFTSPEALLVAGAEHARSTRLRDLVAGWPDPAYLLLLDPLTPLQTLATLATLAQLAATPITEYVAGPGEGPATGSVLQLFLPPRRVHRMLTRNDGLVSGHAVELGDVEHLDTLGALRAALPLPRLDPAITPELRVLHLLRWPAVGAARYRADTEPDGPTRGTGFLPGVEPAVQLYKVPAVKLPDGAELLQVGLDDPAALLASWDAETGTWRWNPDLATAPGR
ncbi:MAG TPA: hypothetical protein VMU51_24255 [Mycobacteriales bacterium]|nr:hypothetical protein [Mycobacteriales bacterium]